MRERDERRDVDPSDPAIPELQERIVIVNREAAKNAWEKELQKSDHKNNLKHFWGKVRTLSGKKSVQARNQPVSFLGRSFNKPAKIAKMFVSQFLLKPKLSKSTHKVVKSIKRSKSLDIPPVFMSDDTLAAIRSAKNSSATGPDGLTVLHLKHLGPKGVLYLTDLFNLSVKCADLPAVYHSASQTREACGPGCFLPAHLPPGSCCESAGKTNFAVPQRLPLQGPLSAWLLPSPLHYLLPPPHHSARRRLV